MLVIGIVAILATLLFPVVIGARERGRQKQAAAEARSILMAIHAYRHEYGKWPAQIQATGDTTYVTNNHWVIRPLLGHRITRNNRTFNEKEKIFLSLPVSSNNPDYATNYLDPWGIPYVICINENGDTNLIVSWSNQPPWSYVAFNPSQREIGATNLYLTNQIVPNVDVGVASFHRTSNELKINTWSILQ